MRKYKTAATFVILLAIPVILGMEQHTPKRQRLDRQRQQWKLTQQLTLLRRAIDFNDIDCAHTMLQRGDVNVNASYSNHLGETALHHAARCNTTAIAKLLMQAGADPMITDRRGATPLHVSVEKESDNTTKLLIKSASNPNARDAVEETPLHYAARTFECRNPDIIITLAQAGAYVETVNLDGKTPLHLAAQLDEPKIIRALLQIGASLVSTNRNGQTALHIAASHNGVLIAPLLLDAGSDPDAVDYNHQTPLHLSIKSLQRGDSSFELCQTLIDANSDLERINGNGQTPLQIAAVQNNYNAQETIRTLLTAGAQLEETE